MKDYEKFINEMMPAFREFHHLIKDGRINEDEFINNIKHRLNILILEHKEDLLKEIKQDVLIYNDEEREDIFIQVGFNRAIKKAREKIDKIIKIIKNHQ